MQAIFTKYLPATNKRGSRIKATCERGSVTIDYPHELSGTAVHRAAVYALIAKFVREDIKDYGTTGEGNPWNRPFVSGEVDGGCVHVFSDPFTNTLVLQMDDQDDYSNVQRYIEKVRATDGTIAGVLAGVACSAVKRSKATALELVAKEVAS